MSWMNQYHWQMGGESSSHMITPTESLTQTNPEVCTQCGEHVGHLMFDGVCANCRNENMREATVQLDD